jgi:hypothetical protein
VAAERLGRLLRDPPQPWEEPALLDFLAEGEAAARGAQRAAARGRGAAGGGVVAAPESLAVGLGLDFWEWLRDRPWVSLTR